jgi:3-hydroxyacyl-CoA dehydrogenase/enoyl-CoA hydratase/3-hydroxybutyryl-CoA epimerase
MVNEAAWCLGDRIVETPGLLDLALITGIGFPPFRGGLLRDADRMGARWIADRLARLAERCGRRFAPAPVITDLAASGGRFHPG